MLDSLLSAVIIAVGSQAEIDRTQASLSAVGIGQWVVGPGQAVLEPGAGRTGSSGRPDSSGRPGSSDRSCRADADPGEMVAAGLEAVPTPWALVLVAGETVSIDPTALGAQLESDAAGGANLVPLQPTGRPETVITDPLSLHGARVVPSAWRPDGARWTVWDELLPTSGAMGAYALQGGRRPFVPSTPPADWAVSVTNRRTLERGERTATFDEALLDASLLTWAGEFDGALAAVRDRTEGTARQLTLAARLRTVCGLASGRDTEARAGAALWAKCEPDRAELAEWSVLLAALTGEMVQPEVMVRARNSEPAFSGPWYPHAAAGNAESRRCRADFTLRAYLSYLDLWVRTSLPDQVTGQAVSTEVVSLWRRMGRTAPELVGRWPAGASSLLGFYLAAGEQGDMKFWLELAKAFVERFSPRPELFQRVRAAAGEMPMSDALMWTLRAAAAGHPELSVLRSLATSDTAVPRDRVLAAALALHHAHDSECAPLLEAAAAQCDTAGLGDLLRALAQTAPGAIPAFLQGASNSDERAQILLTAVEQLKLTPEGTPTQGTPPGNRAQRRAQQRRR